MRKVLGGGDLGQQVGVQAVDAFQDQDLRRAEADDLALELAPGLEIVARQADGLAGDQRAQVAVQPGPGRGRPAPRSRTRPSHPAASARGRRRSCRARRAAARRLAPGVGPTAASRTSSCPEHDGPAIRMTRAASRRATICWAMAAICASCSASATRMISRPRPATMASSSAPTLRCPAGRASRRTGGRPSAAWRSAAGRAARSACGAGETGA